MAGGKTIAAEYELAANNQIRVSTRQLRQKCAADRRSGAGIQRCFRWQRSRLRGRALRSTRSGVSMSPDIRLRRIFRSRPIQSSPAVAFVSKLNSSGTALVYSTYLGGSRRYRYGIAVDASGRAYVTGTTDGVRLSARQCVSAHVWGDLRCVSQRTHARGKRTRMVHVPGRSQ